VRILALSTAVPFPPDDGGRMRVYELLSGLAKEHDVELLTLTGGSDEEHDGARALAGEGVAVHPVPHRSRGGVGAAGSLLRGRSVHGSAFRSRRFGQQLRDRLTRGGVDVVQCEFSSMAGYRADHDRVPWVLDAHNIEFRISARLAVTARGPLAPLYRTYARREARHRQAEEVRDWRRMDHIVAVSRLDRDTIGELAPDVPVTVVPNCIDAQRFHRSPRPLGDQVGAVFVGKMDYRPNVDAVTWFVDAVLPLVRAVVPGFGLTIVGRDPVPRVRALARHPGVLVVGRVDDTVPYLHGAALTVVPLRAGSGSRLKVLEAMATGTPVVSTTLGVEGLDVEPGRHVLVADRPIELADTIVDLLGDPAQRARLADAARDLVEQRYGWPVAVEQLVGVHERAIDEHQGRDG
jgi:sugar transferase (PEP-CTERM/EpsH1 system associated)